MAFDEGLAERIREVMYVVPPPGGTTNLIPIFTEKKMFGGLCFLVSGNMCCGIVGDTLMARVGPDQYAECLKRPHARAMDFTGRPMKGLVYVDSEGIAEDDDLKGWIDRCLAFIQTLPPK